MRADHSCHCVRRPEHHPSSRSNRVRRRVRDKPATQHRRSPGSRETGASSGGRNRAEQHPIPIHPLGAPSPPRSIQGKMLIAISESRRPRRNSVRYPVNADSIQREAVDAAIRFANDSGKEGKPGVVLFQNSKSKFEKIWTYGQSPYPPARSDLPKVSRTPEKLADALS